MPTLAPGSRVGTFPCEIVKVMDDAPGNMSEVYLARMIAPESGETSEVILKLAVGRRRDHSHFFLESLENEVERLRRLNHPGIVRIFPILREGLPNLPYIAEATALVDRPFFSIMEYLPGGSLATRIKEKRLEIGATLEIAHSLAATLDYLHSRHVVHLDIKPDNILFRAPTQGDEAGEPVLIDFGIARDFGQPGLTARTLEYAAPERLAGQGDGAPQTASPALPHPAMDVFALGVVLYEMLTGRLPFAARDPKRLRAEILEANPKPCSAYNSRVNQELDTLVLQMLANDPQRRPSALDVAILLDQVAIKGRYRPRYPNRGPSDSAPAAAAPGRAGILTAVLLIIVLLQLVFIAATFPYWSPQITAALEGLGWISDNLHLVAQ